MGTGTGRVLKNAFLRGGRSQFPFFRKFWYLPSTARGLHLPSLEGRSSLGWATQLGEPFVRIVILLILALLCTSCAKRNDRRTCYPVKGRVLVKGKPASGALVVFYPADRGARSPSASGTADEEGWFSLSTYESDDGAPAGDYDVGITWRDHAFQRQGVLKKSDKAAAADQLKDRYKNPKTSKIRARVEEKPNELPPFDLR